MKKIFISCAGGGTSSLFCAKVNKYANEHAVKTHMNYILDFLKPSPKGFPEEGSCDLVLAYGPTQLITARLEPEHEKLLKQFDLLLICPQTAHYSYVAKEVCKNLDIPCEVIDMKIFARMDGEKGYEYLKGF